MQFEPRDTDAVSYGTFDATHPVNGKPCRVLAVNDDDPASVKWLVAYTDTPARNELRRSTPSRLPSYSAGRGLGSGRDPSNLQSLCKHHHDSAKQMIEHGKSVVTYGVDGYPIELG
ncbi:hypothetical protein [Mesorhizobium sp. M0138]|uniref:hypothetical protein n=1 Tax=Mesorhizobium sp. M0138 TaxID=2956891 RepID=UPI00333729E0